MPVSTVSIPVGQWFTSAEGDRWWFDSGSFALDFAYTGAIGGTPRGAAARPRRPHRVAARAVPRRRRRRPLARPVRRDLAARHDRAHGASRCGARRAGALRRHRPRQPLRGDARHPAGARRRLAAGRSLGADRRTGAVDDRTRRGRPLRPGERRPHPRVQRRATASSSTSTRRARRRRRWCSMQRCGNRAKVRAHRARKAVRCRGLTDARRSGRNTPSRSSGTTRVTSRSVANRTSAREALLDELDRAARRADEVRGRVAEPFERRARDGRLGRGVVDAERRRGRRRPRPQPSWSSIANRIASSTSTPPGRRAPPPRRSRRSCARRAPPAGRGCAPRPPCDCAGLPASTTTPRPSSEAAIALPFGDGSTTGRRARRGLVAGEARRGERGSRLAAATGHDTAESSASAAAPAASPAGQGATGTPRSAAATTAVVNDSTSTTTTTWAPGRMRSAPAAPQSNRTWYLA